MPFLEVLKILLLGIIEGITEWLPVSSTGHLILTERFFPLDKTIFSEGFLGVFEYVVQLAAILAVVISFWKKIFPLGFQKQEGKHTLYLKKNILSLWGKIIVACVPALLAFVVDKLLMENLNETAETVLICCALIFYGLVFIIIEKFSANRAPKVTETAQLSYKTAFFIGCFQLLAIIPGTSRSGITIIGALLLLVSRETAAEFTFFLAIPTMVGASGYKILDFMLEGGVLTTPEWIAMFLGCAVAFAVSMLTIRFLMKFVKKHGFSIFGWYRIALGVLVICSLVLPKLF